MEKDWYNFQEEINEHFKSLGFEAETNKTIVGVRTKHDIDVYVRTKFMGQDLTWIIEAKKWNSKVNKLQVLGLRSIVEDIGSDKGFIISEIGFQKGAIEASQNTNITLLTFDQLKELTIDYVQSERLQHYETRIENIYLRYFTHSKPIRIKYGLRGDLAEFDLPYSVPWVLITANYAIRQGIENNFPIDLETLVKEQYGKLKADNFQQLINWLNINLNVVDLKIFEAETKMKKNNEFNPR